MAKFFEYFLTPQKREAAKQKRKATKRAGQILSLTEDYKTNFHRFIIEHIKAVFEAKEFRPFFDPIIANITWESLTAEQRDKVIRYLPPPHIFAIRHLKKNFHEFININAFKPFYEKLIDNISSFTDLMQEQQDYILKHQGSAAHFKQFLKENINDLFLHEDFKDFFACCTEEIKWAKLTDEQQQIALSTLPSDEVRGLSHLKENFIDFIEFEEFKKFFNDKLYAIKSFGQFTQPQRSKINDLIARKAQQTVDEITSTKIKEKESFKLRQFGQLGTIAYAEGLALITTDETETVENDKLKMARNLYVGNKTRTLDFYTSNIYEGFNGDARAIAFYKTYFNIDTPLGKQIYKSIKRKDEATDTLDDFNHRLEQEFWPKAKANTGLSALFIPGAKSRYNPFRKAKEFFNYLIVLSDIKLRQTLKPLQHPSRLKMLQQFLYRGFINTCAWISLMIFSPLFELGEYVRKNPILFTVVFTGVLLIFFYPPLAFMLPGFIAKMHLKLGATIALSIYTACFVAIQGLKIGHTLYSAGLDSRLIVKDKNFALRQFWRWIKHFFVAAPSRTSDIQMSDIRSEVSDALKHSTLIKLEEEREKRKIEKEKKYAEQLQKEQSQASIDITSTPQVLVLSNMQNHADMQDDTNAQTDLQDQQVVAVQQQEAATLTQDELSQQSVQYDIDLSSGIVLPSGGSSADAVVAENFLPTQDIVDDGIGVGLQHNYNVVQSSVTPTVASATTPSRGRSDSILLGLSTLFQEVEQAGGGHDDNSSSSSSNRQITNRYLAHLQQSNAMVKRNPSVSQRKIPNKIVSNLTQEFNKLTQ